MTVPAVSPGNSLLSAAGSAASGASGLTQLNSDDFMKLLLAQLQQQNPLDPVSNTDFLGQLTQLSTVNSLNTLNTNFTNMMLLQGLTQGAGLIGKTIDYQKPGATAPTTGVVQSVQVQNGVVNLMVNNQPVALAQVIGVH